MYSFTNRNLYILHSASLLSYLLLLGNDELNCDYQLGDSYCFVTKTFLMMGSEVMPKKYSNRISFFTVVIAGTLFYWYWEAMVISYLSVRTIQLPILTLHDLIRKSDLKVRFKTGHI